MSGEDNEGFKVTDKRRFTPEGETRAAKDAPCGETGSGAQAEAPPRKDEGRTFPPIDFITFVLSLASSAQVHLGLIPNPATGAVEKSPELAKQTIDILGILEEKTKGNLAHDEQRLLEGVLYDLRIKYVEIS